MSNQTNHSQPQSAPDSSVGGYPLRDILYAIVVYDHEGTVVDLIIKLRSGPVVSIAKSDQNVQALRGSTVPVMDLHLPDPNPAPKSKAKRSPI